MCATLARKMELYFNCITEPTSVLGMSGLRTLRCYAKSATKKLIKSDNPLRAADLVAMMAVRQSGLAAGRVCGSPRASGGRGRWGAARDARRRNHHLVP